MILPRNVCGNPGADPDFSRRPWVSQSMRHFPKILQYFENLNPVEHHFSRNTCLAINAIKVMRYLSRDFVLISSIIFNLYFFYILLLQKEGCITTQHTPPPQSIPLTITWSQRPTTLCGKDCSSMTFRTQACLCYNLGQNKMRNGSTPPPNSMMYSRYNENAPFFHHWNGGRGGLNFSFILSKIVGYPTFHKIKNYMYFVL